MKNLLLILSVLTVFSGCTFNFSTLSNKKHSTEAIQYFFDENYDQTVKYFDTSDVPDSTMQMALDEFKITLGEIRQSIVNDFGDSIEFKYINSNKEISKKQTENRSLVRIQINNGEYYGQIELYYNDNNGLIRTITYLDIKESVPSLVQFWMLGIYPLLLLVFQIWVIIKVLKSELQKKYLKILLIVIMNYPTLTIVYMKQLFWDSSFQILFGIGLDYDGLNNLSWDVSIPIGSILILIIYRKLIFEKKT